MCMESLAHKFNIGYQQTMDTANTFKCMHEHVHLDAYTFSKDAVYT